MNLSLSKQLLILVIVPLSFSVLTMGMLASILFGIENSIVEQRQAEEVNSGFNHMHDLLSSAHKFSHKGPPGRTELLEIEKLEDEITYSLKKLKGQLKNNRHDLAAIHGMERAFNELKNTSKETNKLLEKGDNIELAEAALTALSASSKFSKQLSELADPINERFQQIEETSYRNQLITWQVLKTLVLSAVTASIAIALLLLSSFAARTNRRFLALTDSARRFSSGQEPLQPIGGKDEIAVLDEMLQQMVAQIKETALLRKEFVATISHELRSPLAAILGSMNVLSDIAADKLSHKALGLVHKNERILERIVRLVNDLLDVEKLEAGRMEMNYEDVPCAYILEQSLQNCLDAAREKAIKISTPQTDACIYADGERLSQVMTNLFSEIIKSSHNDAILQVSLSECNGYLEFAINENGTPFSNEECGNIFDRYRGGKIGLAFCREIVEKHGGQIGVSDSEKSGRRWWFRIPNRAASTDS